MKDKSCILIVFYHTNLIYFDCMCCRNKNVYKMMDQVFFFEKYHKRKSIIF